MELALKQRLVGAGVIIALGVVFIPMILDGSGEKVIREIPPAPKQAMQSKPGLVKPESIPLPAPFTPETKPLNGVPKPGPVKPAIKTKPETKPVKTASSKQIQDKVKKTVKAVAPKVATTKPDQTIKGTVKNKVTTASKSLKSWVVQVGSFSEKSKAIGLQDRLRKKKYRAFVESVKGRSGQTLYRVRVGPDLTRQTSEEVRNKLEKQEKIKGFITTHP